MERCHTWRWHKGAETFRGRSVTSDTSYEFIGRYIGWPVLRQQLTVAGAPCPVRNRLKSTTVKRARFEMTDRRTGVIAIIDRFRSFPPDFLPLCTLRVNIVLDDVQGVVFFSF